MKLATIKKNGRFGLGVVIDQGILDVEHAASHFEQTVPLTMTELIESGAAGHDALQRLVKRVLTEDGGNTLFFPENQIHFGPCVTDPEKILCVGLNYRAHAIESNLPIPTSPVLFSKFNNALAAHNDTIAIPAQTEQMDYEVELVIVIGRQAQNVSVGDALSYVFGYCTGNDLSARDLQFRTGQWLLGKACDGFAPIGPYVVTVDEVPNPNDLQLKCTVNGELRQSSNTQDMVFDCATIVSYISQHMTLKPGDLIFTGTPQGVIMGYPEKERRWLTAKDEIVAEVEKIGALRVILK
ncbi:MAG: fumarylacetoacetate hydrolase family protein [Bacilli bacterium]